MIRRCTVWTLVALVVAVALSACGGSPTPTPPPAAKTFAVEATEFAFAPNSFTAKVGDEVTFNVTNKGALEHNFVVFDPSGKEIGRATIALGGTATVKVKPIVAGAYTIDCDIPGHKEAGMLATLTVNP